MQPKGFDVIPIKCTGPNNIHTLVTKTSNVYLHSSPSPWSVGSVPWWLQRTSPQRPGGRLRPGEGQGSPGRRVDTSPLDHFCTALCRKGRWTWQLIYSNPLTRMWKSAQIEISKEIHYSCKIWRGIKFSGLAVCFATTKLKSTNISYSHKYAWRSLTKLPNLNLPIFIQWWFGPNRQI